MAPHDKHAFRAACLIQERLAKRQHRGFRLDLPEYIWEGVQQLARKIRLARSRGWHAAAAHLMAEFRSQVSSLKWRMTEMDSVLRQEFFPKKLPTEAEVYREIVALKREFDDVEIDFGKHVLRVTVGPIVLEGIDLGRFEIRLDWQKLDVVRA